MKHKNKKHHSDPIVGGSSEREGRSMGRGEFANMPQHAIMKPYPKGKSGDRHLDDSMGRLDDDERDAERRIKKNMSNGMY